MNQKFLGGGNVTVVGLS